jgi:RNase P subunit RPR2
MIERFTCEYCNKPFVVEATVTYKSREEEPEKDFSSKYVSLLD